MKYGHDLPSGVKPRDNLLEYCVNFGICLPRAAASAILTSSRKGLLLCN